ncbi:hypothetical protein HZS_2216 [Henneguya salminicola]|nr:hypothetical protein HZS_2216 [Henneguya salminicola]
MILQNNDDRSNLPKRSTAKVVNFIKYNKQIKVSRNIKNENIKNMDETTILAYMLGRQSVESK